MLRTGRIGEALALAKACVVGGGATGTALLWTLAQDPVVCQRWQATLLHNGSALGGHSMTVPIDYRGVTIPVDIGVQFVAPMLYPNVAAMLGLPEFQQRVGLTPFDVLEVACAFPRNPHTGAPRNWGNFPAYQHGPNFALYDADMAADAARFQDFIEAALFLGWGERTLADFFADPPIVLADQQRFVDFLVSPYMSIMNGYGSADLDQVTFGDVVPLFATIPGLPTPLAAFTKPGTGWARFDPGSSTWVQTMSDLAQRTLTADVRLGATVTAVWTDRETPGNPVHVVWTDAQGEHEETFDKVVLTTDMWTCAALLDNPHNAALWRELYASYIDPAQWPLLPGACYIHTDETILSPDLTEQLETLQFTAYYAPTRAAPGYDLARTFTTYILKNLLDDPAADGLYLTMYGDTAENTRMPDPASVLFSQTWTHGMWAASFMGGPKSSLHLAQGLGRFDYPGQRDTNVYFAGNNTTTDSEEGALDSAMAIANYAFGAKYPIPGAHPIAVAMFLIFYLDVMFPDAPLQHRLAAVRSLHQR
ncbi:MAG TPA: FAD-dependent oxidoreductase [Actinophytocola sp.]|uniref:FAD-dependent oxidoreductase n=1 Tax=Actinophytocola sp. TaxID=1872138 RepID=UPI002DB949AB|nr:FAD-dependent oxidoreductase [Actinophytocola sp.]HEU5469667.1 FAD-dependent oxidoreductase [Actinophytocola sp.]